MTVFHNPDSPQDHKVLRATGIESYNDIPHDPDPDLCESIIGADQFTDQAGNLVTHLHTDCREVTISGGNFTLDRMDRDKP